MTTIKKIDKATGEVTEEIIDSTQQCSIEISKTSKGDTTWKVKIYEDAAVVMEQKIEKYSKMADAEAQKWKSNG